MLMIVGAAPVMLIVGSMESEPQRQWKSEWLRLGLAPLKAYVIGVPTILVLWQTRFREGNPRGWDDRGESQYGRVVAEIFAGVQYGYLACLAGLLVALLIGCRIRDAGAVRASLIYGLVALVCLLCSQLLAQPLASR